MLLVLVVWAVIRKNILRQLSLLELILIESTVTLHIACCKTSQKCEPSLLSLTFPGSAREGAKRLMGVHFSQIQHRNVSWPGVAFCSAPFHFIFFNSYLQHKVFDTSFNSGVAASKPITYVNRIQSRIDHLKIKSLVHSDLSAQYIYFLNFFVCLNILKHSVKHAKSAAAMKSFAMPDLLSNSSLPQTLTFLNRCNIANRGSNVSIIFFFLSFYPWNLSFTSNLRCTCQVLHCAKKCYILHCVLHVTQVCFTQFLAWYMSQYISSTSFICNVQPLYPVFLNMNARSVHNTCRR